MLLTLSHGLIQDLPYSQHASHMVAAVELAGSVLLETHSASYGTRNASRAGATTFSWIGLLILDVFVREGRGQTR